MLIYSASLTWCWIAFNVLTIIRILKYFICCTVIKPTSEMNLDWNLQAF